MAWKTARAVRNWLLGGWFAVVGIGVAVGQEWTPWPPAQGLSPARATQALYQEPEEPEPLPQIPSPSPNGGADQLQILPEVPVGATERLPEVSQPPQPPVVGSVRLNPAEEAEARPAESSVPIAWAQPAPP